MTDEQGGSDDSGPLSEMDDDGEDGLKPLPVRTWDSDGASQSQQDEPIWLSEAEYTARLASLLEEPLSLSEDEYKARLASLLGQVEAWRSEVTLMTEDEYRAKRSSTRGVGGGPQQPSTAEASASTAAPSSSSRIWSRRCPGPGDPREPASKRQRHGDAADTDGAKADAHCGPSSYEDCVNFANWQVKAMLRAVGLDAVSEDSLFARKFVLTTDYSGMGCAEMASDLILDYGIGILDHHPFFPGRKIATPLSPPIVPLLFVCLYCQRA